MLFSQIVYGPISSRRLGTSLGVNLMPDNCKLCTFNCVYCECGWNKKVDKPILPTRQQVHQQLESVLSSIKEDIDVITFSGNGEPTLHPEFENIIIDTCTLRDRYQPSAQVSVLTNSTQLFRQDVVRGLRMADKRILKLDSAIDSTMKLIDQPINDNLTVRLIVDYLKQFNHDFTLQTCFLRGQYYGQIIDNTTDEELNQWFKLVDEVTPKEVMIYVIDRKTPLETLQKIEPEKMMEIANVLKKKGYKVIVSC